MIVIVTDHKDVHADLVEAMLRERDARVFRLDWAEFPKDASLSIDYLDGRKRVRITRRGQVIDLSECTAVWLRRPGRPVVSEQVPSDMLRKYANDEFFKVVQDMCDSLDTAWLPGPIYAIRRADNKFLQLQLATSLGLEIPPTLVTNEPSEMLSFYRRHGGRIIDKLPSVTLPSSPQLGYDFIRFTQPVTTRDVGYARRLRHSPVLFQAYIPKKFELRITVVDNDVLAAEIHSQSTQRTQLDWRHYDWGHTPYRVHELPEPIRRACLDMVARLGLRFGAIDMIVTPDDRYVFLEINPNGQWLWIQHETGLPIAEAVCKALLDPTPPPYVAVVRAPTKEVTR